MAREIKVITKWEGMKWFYHIGLLFAFIAPCWLMFLMLPMPQENWFEWANTLYSTLLMMLVLYSILLGFYITFIYPIYLGICNINKSLLGEHLSGFSNRRKLFVRLGYNVITFVFGILVLWTTLFLMEPFYAFYGVLGWIVHVTRFASVILESVGVLWFFPLLVPLLIIYLQNMFDALFEGRALQNNGRGILFFIGFSLVLIIFNRHFSEWMALPVVVFQGIAFVLTGAAAVFVADFMDKNGEVAA